MVDYRKTEEAVAALTPEQYRVLREPAQSGSPGMRRRADAPSVRHARLVWPRYFGDFTLLWQKTH